MLNRQLRSVFLCLGVLFAMSLNCAMAEDPNFELGGKPGKVMAVVEKEELKLDVDVGKLDDYKDGPKNFTLAIGGCSVKISGDKFKTRILYDLTGSDEVKNLISGLESINSNSDGVVFTGSENSRVSTKCEVTFGEQKDGKYYVPVELEGDVPASFKLFSTEVKMVNPSESSKSDGKVFGAGAIAGISVAIVGAILISGSISGFIFYRWRKNKALQNDDGKKKSLMLKGTESTVSNAPEAEPAEQKPEKSKAPEQKESSSEPKKKSKEPKPKDKSKEPKDNKKKGLSKDKKEPPNDKKKSSKEKLVEKKRKSKEKSKEEPKRAVEQEKQKLEKASDKLKEKAKEDVKRGKRKLEEAESINSDELKQILKSERAKEAVEQDERKLENAHVMTAEEPEQILRLEKAKEDVKREKRKLENSYVMTAEELEQVMKLEKPKEAVKQDERKFENAHVMTAEEPEQMKKPRKKRDNPFVSPPSDDSVDWDKLDDLDYLRKKMREEQNGRSPTI